MYLILFFGLKFLISNIIIILNPLISKRKEFLNSSVLNEFLRKSESTKLEKFDESGFYNLYLLTFDKCCDIFQGILDNTISIIQSILTIAITTIILSWINPIIFIYMFLFILLQTIISNKIKKLGYNFNKQMIEHNKQLNYMYRLFYIPEYMKDLRINNAFDFIFFKKDKEVENIINLTYTSKKKISYLLIISTLFSFIEMFLINGYLGYMVFLGTIWIDMFITSQNSYSQLETSLSSLLDSFNKMYENDLYIKDYLQYMLNNSEIVDGSIQLKYDEIKTITFQDVSFSYPNTKTYALKNISFNIKMGEHILLLGENGAGKTSIIKLLLRLYEPCSGVIKINNIDIKNYSITSLRHSFSTLLQDSTTYAFSIYDNLCLGSEINYSEILDTLEKVNLVDKTNNLKFKLNTPISSQIDNGGIDFSAGERQKLILARCFLKNTNAYILDEPTSNLDAIIETDILIPIIKRKDILMILISHNLKYIDLMDRIIFMKSGTILADGTKDQLFDSKNEYFLQLYNAYNNKFN